MSTPHRDASAWRREVNAELARQKRSIAWLSAECGYPHRSNLWHCVSERGSRSPTADMMARVERVLGVKPAQARCPTCGAVVDAVEGRR